MMKEVFLNNGWKETWLYPTGVIVLEKETKEGKPEYKYEMQWDVITNRCIISHIYTPTQDGIDSGFKTTSKVYFNGFIRNEEEYKMLSTMIL